MTLSVSVVIATFNGAEYVHEQLQSLAHQNTLPNEVIVSDDGSHDQTLSIVREFAESAPFSMRVISNDQQMGFADNFLSAARTVTNDIVAFCDQDDVWLPQKLTFCIDAFKSAAQPSVVIHSAAIVDSSLNEKAVFPVFPDEFLPPSKCPIFPTRQYNGFAMLFRQPILNLLPSEMRPQEHDLYPRMSHDDWIPFLACLSNGITTLSSPLVLHRQHVNQTSDGIGPPRLRNRISNIISTDLLQTDNRSRISAGRVQLLQDNFDLLSMDTGVYEKAVRLCDAYLTYIESAKQRQELYSSRDSLRRRITLLRSGNYGDQALGELGLRSLAKDFLVTMIGAKRLSKFSTPFMTKKR